MERYSKIKEQFVSYYQYYLGRQSDCRNIGLMQLKYEHSYKVAEFATQIASWENFSQTVVELASIAGLLHDIGRFEQVDRYSTLDDLISVDHGNFGEEVLRKNKLLSSLLPEEQMAILFAVRVHNKRAIKESPDSLSECLSKIVRDSDKLDVFRVMHHNMLNGSEIQKRAVLLNLRQSNEISEEVLQFIEQRLPVNKEVVKTTTDFNLLQLSWIFDLNYTSSRSVIRNSEHYRFLLDDFVQKTHHKEIFDIFVQYMYSFAL